MRKSQLFAALMFLFVGVCRSQSTSDSLLEKAAADCSDPSRAASPECSAAQAQRSGGAQGRDYSSPAVPPPVLRTSPDFSADQHIQSPPSLNPSQLPQRNTVLRPETEFQQMVADSVGRVLPLFGQSYFGQPPSTFAPIDQLQVSDDYIIGAGDELRIRIWGQVEADLRVMVDRAGQIYIPQVGEIPVAGVHYSDLEQHLKGDISKVFKNFNITASVGRLRSIQIVIVGDARYPGTYTISSLSTLVNAIFASGGPAPQGSLRHIQVRRDGATITDFDFYDLLLKGDKSKDVRLQPGDVLFIPHIGPQAAIAGSVNLPAIYELKENSTLNDLIEMSGDLSNVADSSKITIDRFADNARKTLEFPLDAQSRALPIKDGDIVRVFSIIPRFEDTVTLRGHVANPGRYSWKPGMRVRDLIPDAAALLTRRYWNDRAAIVNGRATEYPVRGELPRTAREGSETSRNSIVRDDGIDAAHSSGLGTTSQVGPDAGAALLKPGEPKSLDTNQRSQAPRETSDNPSLVRN